MITAAHPPPWFCLPVCTRCLCESAAAFQARWPTKPPYPTLQSHCAPRVLQIRHKKRLWTQEVPAPSWWCLVKPGQSRYSRCAANFVPRLAALCSLIVCLLWACVRFSGEQAYLKFLGTHNLVTIRQSKYPWSAATGMCRCPQGASWACCCGIFVV